MSDSTESITWPPRHNVIGVPVSAATYASALAAVMPAAHAHRSTAVTHLAVHGVVEASKDPEFRAQIAQFDIVAPDGHPVRIALNKLYHCGLPDRCYGPDFTLAVCEACAAEGVSIYLYGSQKDVVEAMRDNLAARFPGLQIVGCEPSLFRPLTSEEDAELVARINASGAGFVFVGLGCPLQEKFTADHKGRINAVMIAVGAAFDFHAGKKSQAPKWMQDHSLEWFYRLMQEPSRLWRRYLFTNTTFVWRFTLQYLGLRKFSS
jgi:exopolysaccharide biosynthesis WecB/TagA/CpsF family protein